MSEVDVLVENFTIIDWDIHELWVKGLSVTETVIVLRERGILSEYPGVTQEMLVSDINDHYRLFAMLENLLMTVGTFSEQLLFQMTPETQDRLLETYYSLDSNLCRELLGRKLSSRLRKDLDELSEKTGTHLKSCRRQFDNIKRIFKTIEDMPGCYVQNIQKIFYISEGLAEQYAAIIFMSMFRFELNKKKLNSLSFDSIKNVSLIIMDNWLDCDDENEPNLDKDLVASLKEFKSTLEKDKDFKSLKSSVGGKLQKQTELISPRSCKEIEANFKTMTRNLLAMAQSLTSSRELKDFFIHFSEKIVDPMKQMQLSKSETKPIFMAYCDAITENGLVTDDVTLQMIRNFLQTLSKCVLVVY